MSLIGNSAPNVAAHVRNNGRARLGGHFSQSYLHSYLRASSILVGETRDSDTLGEVAVACVYLQRHVLELALKTLLARMHAIAENDVALALLEGRAVAESIPDAERKHLNGSHDLPALLADVRNALAREHAAGATYTLLPDELAAMVDEFTNLERSMPNEQADPSRLRYPNVKVPESRRRDPKDKHEREPSFPKSVSVAVGELQERLERLIDELFKDIDQPTSSLGRELDITLQAQNQDLYNAGAL
jgi:hypothetical protein